MPSSRSYPSLERVPGKRDRTAQREYARRLQAADPERKRAINRRWAANRSTEEKRAARQRTRARRGNVRVPGLHARAYDAVIRVDPCSYCGCPQAGTSDHIVPLIRGGSGDWDNLTGACQSCNASKGAKSLLEVLLAIV